jgi:Holliday junction resolvase RusA-like endonuclease
MIDSDKYKIVDLYSDLIKSKSKKYLYVIIYIEPYSKSNNLFYGNRKAYVPKRFKDNDEIVIAVVKEVMEKRKMDIFSCPVWLQIDGYYSTKRVVDAPNLSKSVCDALNGVAYHDDRQIIYCSQSKTYDKDNPRIEILLVAMSKDHDLVNMKPMLDRANQPKIVGEIKKIVKPKIKKVKSGTRKRIKKQTKK